MGVNSCTGTQAAMNYENVSQLVCYSPNDCVSWEDVSWRAAGFGLAEPTSDRGAWVSVPLDPSAGLGMLLELKLDST